MQVPVEMPWIGAMVGDVYVATDGEVVDDCACHGNNAEHREAETGTTTAKPHTGCTMLRGVRT